MQDHTGHSHPIDPEIQHILDLLAENHKEQAKSMKVLRDHIERLDENNILIEQAFQRLCYKVAHVEADVTRIDAAD